MVSDTLARRSTALWLFIAGFVGLLLTLKFTGREKETEPLVTPSPQKPAGPNWIKRLSLVPAQFEEKTAPETEQSETQKRSAWAKKLRPSKAKLQNKRLVQTLSDGTKLWLTLDPRLQRNAHQLLRKYEVPYGAVVMIDIKTANLLVMAGYSAADPGLRDAGLCLNAWAPAASVFKIVTAAALLSENRSRPFTRVCFHGGTHGLQMHHLIDDKKKDTECDTLSGGLAKSINPIFGKLALRHLDRNTLLKYANAFGFNQKLRFVRPLAVAPANIPKHSFDRAKVAAGFWHTNMSPLHGAMLAHALANRGKMIRPRLVEAVHTSNGKKRPLPPSWSREVVTEYIAKLLSRMMVMTTTVGTAKDDFYDRRGRAYVPWGKTAGKTGSLTREDPYVFYNWFVGFTPRRNPEVAIAVLLGNPKKWRIKAATMARLMLQAYGRLRPHHLPSLPTAPNSKKDKPPQPQIQNEHQE
jgi:cell division protein FtsI/penicillin-binding protein 2